MGRTLRRTAAFTAIFRALTASMRGGPSLARRMSAIPRMMWASLTGRYDGLARIGLVALATLYVVSPIDLVPELALAFVGLIDDAVVVTWIAGALLDETERFLLWEEQRRDAAPGRSAPQGAQQGDDVLDGEVV